MQVNENILIETVKHGNLTENLPLTYDHSSASVEPDLTAPVYADAAVQAVKLSADVACEASPDERELHCRSCDVEFPYWIEYLKHMKKFSFMCSNCLDYFAEQPWFSITDLIFIDVDGGVQIYLKDTVLDLTRYEDHYLKGTT